MKWELEKLNQIARGVGGVIVIAFGIAFALAIRQDSGGASAAFAGMSAVLALFGLAAIALALPQAVVFLRDRARRPRISLHVLLDTVDGLPEPIDDRVEVNARMFDLRVVVSNEQGEDVAPLLGGIVNIMVLDECEIEARPPDDIHDRSRLRPARGVYPNSEISANGEVVGVRFVVAERDYTPGHDFAYHVHVRAPGPGEWPVRVVLDGDPPPSNTHQVVIVVTGTDRP